ncbi:oxaloacetate decarboxylase subunit gamma [Vibrio aerogenes CECT 7868]|uniref:Probable oxaloacetate decarboxylase gamma chain n=1 Tax=Vibrio aerogenes CECT 7868 TaxID=1216006 RepID=A0A1M5ZKK4_9VIBR|nr:OadG family protein [Vibrio aerogenes]SHI24473.1 oxaloacetate decarboxylase subunit gamma [Vibrio aerogenes CECT 7868]
MNESLFSEGVTLMLLGMGFVFVFLMFLVVMIHLQTKLTALLPESQHNQETQKKNKPAGKITPANSDGGQLIAVLTAAVHQHRKALRGES